MKTLKELKDFLNTLNNEQLSGGVMIAGNADEGESGIIVTSFWELEEDYFVSDEGFCPVSTHDEDYNDLLKDCEIIKKGTVYLCQN